MSDRQRHLIAAARAHFGRAPAHLVRAPGRVNLIGEHTDYNGLPVLPMAIDRDILVAVAPRSDGIVNLFSRSRFAPRRYALGDPIVPFPAGDWGNYSKAAAQGLLRAGARLTRGADLMIDGNVPSGAGLSSSSALVVANALSLLAANAIELPYPALAEVLPQAERYVGTLSGGMDQTISLLARAGHALRIDFFPLRHRAVPLPPGHSFVVCHSLVAAEKSGAAKRAYNLRVVECALACQLLRRALELPAPLQRLGDLRRAFPERRLGDFAAALDGWIEDRPLALDELEDALDDRGAIAALAQEAGVSGPFAPVRRLRHVLSESDRVDDSERALGSLDPWCFGRLMNESHASCRDDYEISCPELEELVALADSGGALGARLTGAGFGGCTVSLVPEAQIEPLLARVDHHFYRPRLRDERLIISSRFVLQPVGGAEVVALGVRS